MGSQRNPRRPARADVILVARRIRHRRAIMLRTEPRARTWLVAKGLHAPTQAPSMDRPDKPRENPDSLRACRAPEPQGKHPVHPGPEWASPGTRSSPRTRREAAAHLAPSREHIRRLYLRRMPGHLRSARDLIHAETTTCSPLILARAPLSSGVAHHLCDMPSSFGNTSSVTRGAAWLQVTCS